MELIKQLLHSMSISTWFEIIKRFNNFFPIYSTYKQTVTSGDLYSSASSSIIDISVEPYFNLSSNVHSLLLSIFDCIQLLATSGGFSCNHFSYVDIFNRLEPEPTATEPAMILQADEVEHGCTFNGEFYRHGRTWNPFISTVGRMPCIACNCNVSSDLLFLKYCCICFVVNLSVF